MLRSIGRRVFDFDRQVAVMAVLNRTPDSFSDKGATWALDKALDHADRALEAGADWLDVGGVKAGPGAEVTEAEELRRVLPLLEALRDRTDAVVSRTRPYRPAYADVVAEVAGFLGDRAAVARAHGVSPERLVIDPGYDFHKNTFHSLELLRRLDELPALGYPILVALSNKDFVGETLDLPVDERVEGSLAAAVVAVTKGARIIRVHQVEATVRAVRMTEAILGWRRPAATRRGLA